MTNNLVDFDRGKKGETMHYQTPKINFVQVEPFISKQQTGAPKLNPDCNSGTGCDLNGKGAWCSSHEPDPTGVFLNYFLPGKTCPSESYNPCTIKVNGEAMACTESQYCVEDSCGSEGSRTSGAVIHCSGDVPGLNCDSFTSDEVEVDCGPSDFTFCA